MAALVAVCTLLLAALVVWVVSGPLRRAGATGGRDGDASARGGAVAGGPPSPPGAVSPEEASRRAELESAREVKYREIRDAELDYRTGKLSEHDYRAIDAELREQALALLDEIELREDEREGP
ncbi:MAG: hypothetical protein ACYDC2_13665 [Solirubrobacteraceae bacterium]